MCGVFGTFLSTLSCIPYATGILGASVLVPTFIRTHGIVLYRNYSQNHFCSMSLTMFVGDILKA